MKHKGIVFLDRDGTIIVERHHLTDPGAVTLIDGAAEGIRLLRLLGYTVAVVTNQSVVGRGLCDTEAVHRVHRRMLELLTHAGAHVDAVLFCPHHPNDGCACRKPRPGLLLEAKCQLGVSLHRSIVIGDKPCDLQAGTAVGAYRILVRTGYGRHHEKTVGSEADLVVDGVLDAARKLEESTCH